ncbi:aminotransferase class V-fold PLP-dependent enzyme [Pseudomonas sp. NPDC086251]|uniref:aminotransferase class V-fold PLP-dependent enzyme n=1 Tax=Pseudomonas sp. NPDC086251 TaxID=3364431 RepID=UPI0038356412
MVIARRDFLKGTVTASLASSLLLSPAVGVIARELPLEMDPHDWASIRAQFKLASEVVHLSNFFLASTPLPVREAMARHRQAFDENPYTYLEDHMFGAAQDMLWRKVCVAAADYVNGQAEEIALTTSTTQGLSMIYNGLRLQPHQEILTTTHEWYTHDEAMRLASLKWGASIRRIDLYQHRDEVSAERIVEQVRHAIMPATRVVAMTWVHSGTGVRLPIKDIGTVIIEANRKREQNNQILYVVDGVHGFGCIDQDVSDLGCDFFSSGTHKWILGPHGTGLVWAKEASWAHIIPTIPSIMASEPANAWRQERAPMGATQACWVSPGGFLAFENQWGVIEAFEFIKQIGRKRIADRVAQLNGALKEGLEQMHHVTLHTPLQPELSAGIVCCEVKGMEPRAVVSALKNHSIIASATPYRQSTVRFSAGIVNSTADIEKTLKVMASLA